MHLNRVAVIAAALMSTSAWGHPGHAIELAPADSPLHYMIQPEHALFAIAAAMAFVLCLWRIKAGRERIVRR